MLAPYGKPEADDNNVGDSFSSSTPARSNYRRIRSMPDIFDRNTDSRWGSTEDQNVDLTPPAFRGLTSPSRGRRCYLRSKQSRSYGRLVVSPERGGDRDASMDSFEPPFPGQPYESEEGTEEGSASRKDKWKQNRDARKGKDSAISPSSLYTSRHLNKSAMKKKGGLLYGEFKEASSMSSISLAVGGEDSTTNQDSLTSLNSFGSRYKDNLTTGTGEEYIANFNPDNSENRWNASCAQKNTNLAALLPPAFRGWSTPTKARRIMASLSSDSLDVPPPLTDDDASLGGASRSTVGSSDDGFIVDDRLSPAYQVLAKIQHKRKSTNGSPESHGDEEADSKTELEATESVTPEEVVQQRKHKNGNMSESMDDLPPAFQKMMEDSKKQLMDTDEEERRMSISVHDSSDNLLPAFLEMTTQDSRRQLMLDTEGEDRKSIEAHPSSDNLPPAFRKIMEDSKRQLLNLDVVERRKSTAIQDTSDNLLPAFQQMMEDAKRKLKDLEQEEPSSKKQGDETELLPPAFKTALTPKSAKKKKVATTQKEQTSTEAPPLPSEVEDLNVKETEVAEDEPTPSTKRSWKVKRIMTVDSFRRENPKEKEITAAGEEDGANKSLPNEPEILPPEEKESMRPDGQGQEHSSSKPHKKKRSWKAKRIITVDSFRREKEANEALVETKESTLDSKTQANDAPPSESQTKKDQDQPKVVVSPKNVDDQAVDISPAPKKKRSWKVKRVMTVNSFRRENNPGVSASAAQNMAPSSTLSPAVQHNSQIAANTETQPSNTSESPKVDNAGSRSKNGRKKKRRGWTGTLAQKWDERLPRESVQKEQPPPPSPPKSRKPKRRGSTGDLVKKRTEKRRVKSVAKIEKIKLEKESKRSSKKSPPKHQVMSFHDSAPCNFDSAKQNDIVTGGETCTMDVSDTTGALAHKSEAPLPSAPGPTSPVSLPPRRHKRQGSTGALADKLAQSPKAEPIFVVKRKTRSTAVTREIQKIASVSMPPTVIEKQSNQEVKLVQSNSNNDEPFNREPVEAEHRDASTPGAAFLHQNDIQDESRCLEDDSAKYGYGDDGVDSMAANEPGEIEPTARAGRQSIQEHNVSKLSSNDGEPFDCQPMEPENRVESTPAVAMYRHLHDAQEASRPSESDCVKYGYDDVGSTEANEPAEIKPGKRPKRRGSTGVLVKTWEDKLLPTVKPTASPPSSPAIISKKAVRKVVEKRRGSTGAFKQHWDKKFDTPLGANDNDGMLKKELLNTLLGIRDPTAGASAVKSDNADDSVPFDCQPMDQLDAQLQVRELPSGANEAGADPSEYAKYEYGDTGDTDIIDTAVTKPRSRQKRRGSTGALAQMWEAKLNPQQSQSVSAPSMSATSRKARRRGSSGALVQQWEEQLKVKASSPLQTSSKKFQRRKERSQTKQSTRESAEEPPKSVHICSESTGSSTTTTDSWAKIMPSSPKPTLEASDSWSVIVPSTPEIPPKVKRRSRSEGQLKVEKKKKAKRPSSKDGKKKRSSSSGPHKERKPRARSRSLGPEAEKKTRSNSSSSQKSPKKTKKKKSNRSDHSRKSGKGAKKSSLMTA